MGNGKQKALLGRYCEWVDLAVDLQKSGDEEAADTALREATEVLHQWEYEESRQRNIERWPLKHERYFKQ